MKKRKEILFCACLFFLGIFYMAGQAGAEENASKAITYREYVESEGHYYGESGDCMYTYTEDGKEIKIIGFRMDAKKIKIPNKIEEKKVTEVALEAVYSYATSYSDYHVDEIEAVSIDLPENVKTLSGNFVEDVVSLKNFKKYTVSSKNKYFKAEDGVLFTKDGKTLLSFPHRKKRSSYTVPKGTKTIGKKAFMNTIAVQKVSMPDTVKTIDSQAFYSCDATFISLPKKLKKLGRAAFVFCNISEVTIPGTVKTIPTDCFSSCSRLKKVTVREGVKNIGGCAFADCKNLRKVYIPTSVKKGEYGKGMSIDSFIYRSSHWDDLEVNLTIYAKKNSDAYKAAKKWKKYGIKVKAA